MAASALDSSADSAVGCPAAWRGLATIELCAGGRDGAINLGAASIGGRSGGSGGAEASLSTFGAGVASGGDTTIADVVVDGGAVATEVAVLPAKIQARPPARIISAAAFARVGKTTARPAALVDFACAARPTCSA